MKQNQLLADLTTFQIGGPALYLAEVTTEVELKEALDFARAKKLPVFIIGGGSNILVSDQGFNGVVIHNQLKRLTIDESGLVTVGAGENWDDVVASAVQQGLAGIECLSGVPGSAAGAIVQNIGAYGQTIGDLVSSVYAVEVATGNVKEFSAAECEFEYRNSWFKRHPNKFIITKFELQLHPGSAATAIYPEIQKRFAGQVPTLAEVRRAVIEIRASKGYVIMPGFESYKTAGSFFKNPIISKEQFEKIKAMFGDSTSNQFWEMPDSVKLSAAYLIEQSGFGKGYREGNVGISPKHSLGLMNYGGASAEEIKSLADKIKQSVLMKFGVKLEEEVLYI